MTDEKIREHMPEGCEHVDAHMLRQVTKPRERLARVENAIEKNLIHKFHLGTGDDDQTYCIKCKLESALRGPQ